jgi:hypothetical protein
MNFPFIFSGNRGTHSVVRIRAVWHAAILAMALFSERMVAAGQMCLGIGAMDLGAVNLDTCRPAAVDAEEKALVLKSLPSEGEVTQLTESERQKLKDLGPVLRLHVREGVYELKVIAVPQAWVGLHGRAVLLISLPALRLLDSEELQALVAHEIGHEYVWQEYALARARNDTARLRELELACDSIAVLTLARIGVKPVRLVTAVEKGFRFNHDRFGRLDNENSYPSLKTRRELVKRMSAPPRRQYDSGVH